MASDDGRKGLWIALGQQPGVSAWFTVWRLSRLAKRAARQPKPATKAASMPGDSSQVCAGH
ncbi:MAG: hypothetical protein ACHQAZ_02945 [Gammaproteobacteria bacterium]